jgi:hypothetical protein
MKIPPDQREEQARVLGVYPAVMRRIQLYLDEELDHLLEAEAARLGVSKASLVRDAVAARFETAQTERDPIDELIGAFDGAAGESVDDVVYGA